MRASFSSTRGGFTLVELVLALGILGIVLSTLIFLRLEAVRTVTEVAEERELRRLAQELLEQKLAESMGDLLEAITGEFADRPGWTWEWIEDVMQEGGEYLLSYTVMIYYPDPIDPQAEAKTYELSAWLLPTEEQRAFIEEQRQLMIEEGYGSYGTSYGY